MQLFKENESEWAAKLFLQDDIDLDITVIKDGSNVSISVYVLEHSTGIINKQLDGELITIMIGGLYDGAEVVEDGHLKMRSFLLSPDRVEKLLRYDGLPTMLRLRDTGHEIPLSYQN